MENRNFSLLHVCVFSNCRNNTVVEIFNKILLVYFNRAYIVYVYT